MAELGWFAFLAPDELGGGGISGKGVLDAVILAEERGKVLQPGPFIDTNVVVAAIALEGTDEQTKQGPAAARLRGVLGRLGDRRRSR